MLKTRIHLYDWIHYYEKMQYDTAMPVRVYRHAPQMTKEPAFNRIVEKISSIALREMSHEPGGFDSSLDANSNGEKCKFSSYSGYAQGGFFNVNAKT